MGRKADAKTNRNAAKAVASNRRRRRRTGRRTLHYIALVILLGGAGLIVSLTVLFKVEAVNVIGTDRYDPLALARASGIVEGDNLWRISKNMVEGNLLTEEHPYIDSVEIVRRIPSTVEIHITQSEPGGAVKEGEDYVLITKDGKVLERGTFYIPEEVPLILGLDTAGVAPGHYLGQWEKQPKGQDETEEQTEARLALDAKNREHADSVKASLIMLEYLYGAMEESDFRDITNVDISDIFNIRIMYENRLLLELGTEADLAYKMEFVREIITTRLEPEARGTLHAGNVKDSRVVFSPAEDYVEKAPSPEKDRPEETEEDEPPGLQEVESSGESSAEQGNNS